jgi:hypothetical protein
MDKANSDRSETTTPSLGDAVSLPVPARLALQPVRTSVKKWFLSFALFAPDKKM